MVNLETKGLRIKKEDLSILVVDDSPTSSEMLRTVLKSLGYYDVDIAKTKEKVFKLCSKKTYEIIVMDYHLEDDLNGVTLIKLLKEKSFIREETSCLIISGDNSKNTILDTMYSCASSYIYKPYTKKIISEKMIIAEREHRFFGLIKKREEIERDDSKVVDYIFEIVEKINSPQSVKTYLINKILKTKRTDLFDKLKESDFGSIPFYKFLKLKDKEKTIPEEKWFEEYELFCLENKMLFEAQEYLLEKKLEKNMINESIDLILELINSMPSNSLSMLRMAKIGLKINNKEIINAAGKSLLKFSQQYHKNWFANIALYFSYLTEYIKKNNKNFNDNMKLLKFLESSVKTSALTDKNKEEVILQIKITESICYFNEGQTLESKRKISKTLMSEINKLESMKIESVLNVIELLYNLGEIRLFRKLTKEMSKTTYYSYYSKIRVKQLKEKLSTNKLSKAEEMLNQASKALLDNNPIYALDVYRQIRVVYPYSSEVSLGIIDCHLKINSKFNLSVLKPHFETIKDMPLYELENWKNMLIRDNKKALEYTLSEKVNIDLSLTK